MSRAARRYIAFLRSINVGGRTVPMATLKRIFQDLDLWDVETFIASGNVIFSAAGTAASLERRIEAGLERSLGFEVRTFLRTTEEVAAVAERDPFGEPLPAGGRLYVGFCGAAPSAAVTRKLLALATPTDALAVAGRELYWRSLTTMQDAGVSPAMIEKALEQPVTLRNVNTVRRLAEKYRSR